MTYKQWYDKAMKIIDSYSDLPDYLVDRSKPIPTNELTDQQSKILTYQVAKTLLEP